ncbi:arylacetamide deacetylase-like 4 [Gastrophryne carolinensis]
MLVLVICVFLVVATLLLLGATYIKSSKAEYPPGLDNPSVIRTAHQITTGFSILGKALEKLGIWSEVGLLRFISALLVKKLGEDPELVIKNVEFEGVPVRIYQPKAPSTGSRKGVMYFHGGGFVYGSIESYDHLCRHIAKTCDAVVASVGYRLAPEHRYPAALDDCISASIYFLKTTEQYGVDPSSVIICGDSAGGNLTACVTQVLVTKKDIPKPLAQVMIYPATQLIDLNLPSYQQNSMVPILLRDITIYFILTYIGADLSLLQEMQNGNHIPPEFRKKFSKWLSADRVPDEFKVRGYKPYVPQAFNNDVYQKVKHVFDVPCSPLIAEDSIISQLPKSYILTCEFDVLRDDGILYKKRLEDNRVPVTWYHVKNGFHGVVNYFNAPNVISGKEDDLIVTTLKEALLDYFEVNETPEVSATLCWEAHKATIRGKIIQVAARKKRDRNEYIDRLEKEYLQVSEAGKQGMTPELQAKLHRTSQELNLELAGRPVKALCWLKSKYYCKANKPSSLLAKKLKAPPQSYCPIRLKDERGVVTNIPTRVVKSFKHQLQKLYSNPSPPSLETLERFF